MRHDGDKAELFWRLYQQWFPEAQYCAPRITASSDDFGRRGHGSVIYLSTDRVVRTIEFVQWPSLPKILPIEIAYENAGRFYDSQWITQETQSEYAVWGCEGDNFAGSGYIFDLMFLRSVYWRHAARWKKTMRQERLRHRGSMYHLLMVPADDILECIRQTSIGVLKPLALELHDQIQEDKRRSA